jgi:hypothetical protein
MCAVCNEDLLRFVSFESKFILEENGLNENRKANLHESVLQGQLISKKLNITIHAK